MQFHNKLRGGSGGKGGEGVAAAHGHTFFAPFGHTSINPQVARASDSNGSGSSMFGQEETQSASAHNMPDVATRRPLMTRTQHSFVS
ncbi:unnamed protein product [Pieris brassicae]|uniref:Uncharacterized protein n=1 Tax=Pieris brassicae TaxID=7116 RepID=A0A9P0X4F4_PIEBR|nr:unnamed protein product [Pieris brassicae]